jgi:hypothetical protein
VDLRLNSPVTSLKELLATGEFDAAFVDNGAGIVVNHAPQALASQT